jgi:hypothetical protein
MKPGAKGNDGRSQSHIPVNPHSTCFTSVFFPAFRVYCSVSAALNDRKVKDQPTVKKLMTESCNYPRLTVQALPSRAAAVYPIGETVAHVYARPIFLPLAPAARALMSPQSSQRWHPSNGFGLHAGKSTPGLISRTEYSRICDL